MILDKRPDLHDQIGAARQRDSLSQEDSMVQPHGAAPISAHQRKIAEKARKTMKRERLTSLDGCYVKAIERALAEPIILRFEWLGDMGTTSIHFVGLFTAEHELIGVACFGSGPADVIKYNRNKKAHGSTLTIRDRLGGSAMCLERGACVPHAPPNAASFLISHACKLMLQITTIEGAKQDPPVEGVSRFFAYGDPDAHEYGGVYQASNWIYLGQGLNGEKDRKKRYKVLEPKFNNPKDRKNPRNWKTTRVLRRPGKRPLHWGEARKKRYLIEPFPAKHVYAIKIGEGQTPRTAARDARRWREAMQGKPFPKPRPELTLKAERARRSVKQSASS